MKGPRRGQVVELGQARQAGVGATQVVHRQRGEVETPGALDDVPGIRRAHGEDRQGRSQV